MKLLKLPLENLKGIRSFTLDTKGENVAVFGDNAAGKTTLADAFMWLLFDKDSRNRKDFQIKTLDENGEPIHGLDHGVSATLELATGGELRLRKVYKEVWTKKRGQAKRQFTGHTTDYYIDGVPVQQNEYKARVAEIADEGVFRLLTDPLYFNDTLPWKERRSMLLQVCGDVSDADVIGTSHELAVLPKILGDRSLDEHRKVIDARRREINNELDRIPVRIDELNKTLPEPPDKDRTKLETELAELKAERQTAEQEKARIEAGGEVAERKKRVAEIDTEMLEIKNELRAQGDTRLEEQRAEHRELTNRIDVLEREIRRIEGDQDQANKDIQHLAVEIDGLKAHWYEVNEEQFDHNHTENCPTCGQGIPKKQALEAFNADKAARLTEINETGKRKKAQLEEIRFEQERRKANLTKKQGELATLQEQSEQFAQAIMQAAQSAPSPDGDPDYRKLSKGKAELIEAIKSLEAGSAEAIKEATDRINALDDQIYFVQINLSQFEQRDKAKARIAELTAQEKELAAEFEKLEYESHLCDAFVRSKVRLLEERINSCFQLARFKLFNTLVNGGIEECCETMFEGVPFSALNHGARLNVGIDVINTLANQYGFAPPVFIDNAESVTRILPTIGQAIKLVVSAQDKQLRIEAGQREAVLV